jgi:hypothetical protein
LKYINDGDRIYEKVIDKCRKDGEVSEMPNLVNSKDEMT